MTTLKELLGLRPKPAASAAELAEALSRAEAARAEALARAAALETKRGTVLLDGTPADAEKAEAALSAARADAERAAALAAATRQRLAETERRDRLAKVEAMRAAAEDAGARFLAFARNEYPRLAAQIAEGLAYEAAAHRIQLEMVAVIAGLPHAERAELSFPNPPRLLTPAGNGTGIQAHGLGAFVRLPAADGDSFAGHWPQVGR